MNTRRNNLAAKAMYHIKENEISLLVSLLFPLLVSFTVFVNYFSWNTGNFHPGLVDRLQELFSVVWIIPLPVALLSLLGMVLYKGRTSVEHAAIPFLSGQTIYFRLATRGINQHTVLITAANVMDTMEQVNRQGNSAISYVMEIITEKTNPPLVRLVNQSRWKDGIVVLEVPQDYATENKALFKARALHYATQHSGAKENDWIFHLDDESQINKATVLGIAEFIAKEEGRIAKDPQYKPRIGQGTILYHRNMRQNLLYTLADSIRTADDIGRYFLQYLCQVCIFGMHGSFILARNSVEKQEGFDLLPAHCITEDAYWGLKLMQKGYKFGHVNGFLHEQSPEKSLDFVKQRRRWFRGITKVIQAKDISMRYKCTLSLMTVLWACSGLIVFYTALNIIHPVPIPALIGFLASVAFSVYVLMYMIGYYVNSKYARIPAYRKVLFFIAQIAFIPIFALLEASGAVYGLLDRRLDFYVIKK